MISLFSAPPPVCRALAAIDAPAAAVLHAEGFVRGWSEGDIESMILESAVIADGAFAAGRRETLIGFCLSHAAADEAEILSICVRRKDRGRGVAGRLLAHHLSRVGQRGARALFLEVEEGNAPAIALYRRYGFVEIGKRPSYYHKPDGRTANAIVMRREMG